MTSKPEFGSSGLRGLSSDLTDDLCATYAAAFVALHGGGGTLMIGQDKRDSSPRIAAAVARGARVEGVTVVDCGVLPTPALALAAKAAGAVAIMVTGSHIPADRNGLKFYTRAGEFTKADEGPLADAVAARDVPDGQVTDIRTDPAARDGYVKRYNDAFAPDALAGLRIGFWEHSSAASEVLPEILARLGAEVVRLGASETFVSVDTEAVDGDTRDMLARWVLSERLDALLSADGDADRPLLVDNLGRVVAGDILGPVTARWCGADEVVTTVSANTLVDLMGAFGCVTRTRIGSPYVIAAMEARLGAGVRRVAGYEPNGGFLLGWDMEREGRPLSSLMTRDAVLPMLATLASAVASGQSVSEMLAEYPERRTATDRLKDIPRERSLALVDALLSGDYGLLPDDLGVPVSIDTTDGARMTFASGHIVSVRPSGNAPELRCYVEADSDLAANEVLQVMLERLRAGLSRDRPGHRARA
jgi:phosphomannomutase